MLESDETQKEGPPMFPLSRVQFLNFAAAGALVALTAAGTPARADELLANLGPVGPYEPLLTTFGSKRMVAFYVPDTGHCAVNAVIWENPNADTDMPYSSARVRISLRPGQIFHIDSAENQSLNLQCGDNAATLALDTGEFIAPGATKETGHN
jgi:hypothetical protein